jgi:hypothetical protein
VLCDVACPEVLISRLKSGDLSVVEHLGLHQQKISIQIYPATANQLKECQPLISYQYTVSHSSLIQRTLQTNQEEPNQGHADLPFPF